MHRLIVTALLALSLFGAALPARADGLSAGQLVLMKLFGPDPITADMFTPQFLTQASLNQILSVFTQTRAAVGPPVSIEPSGSGYIVHTANFAIPVDIGLDQNGRVASLLLHTPVQQFAQLDDVFAAIDALPGKLSYVVTRDGVVLRARGQALPLAVSSGYKLGVLAVVADEIAAGRLTWDRVARLTPGQISLPPGLLQGFPAGSPVTVHTLAALMVSESDNTATDALIDLVGRDKVAAKLGIDFVLKTVEFYKLKADPALRLRFAAADAAGREKAAAQMASMPLPDPADAGGVLNPGIEWYLSSTKLCQLATEVAGLDVFGLNTGVARKADWPQIAFKGGSEVGVASLTTALTDKAGTHFCVSVTWNDGKALNEDRITSLYGSVLEKLAGK